MNIAKMKQTKKILLILLIALITCISTFFIREKIREKGVKILVAYHKKAPLPKESYYIPIHAGRAVANSPSKDGALQPGDLEWLLWHC